MDSEKIIADRSNCMFNCRTGEIYPLDYKEMDLRSSIQMYKGWTPYYNIEGEYIGFKCRSHYRKPNFKTVKTYWGLTT